MLSVGFVQKVQHQRGCHVTEFVEVGVAGVRDHVQAGVGDALVGFIEDIEGVSRGVMEELGTKIVAI